MERGLPPTQRLGRTGVIHALLDGGEEFGRTAAGYVLQTERITPKLQGRHLCLDLGCGIGMQLGQLARLNPEVTFVGVDHDPEALQVARDRLGHLPNVRFVEDDMVTLRKFKSHSVDAVISTMALHELADQSALTGCMVAINRVLVPDGVIHLEDFSLLQPGPRQLLASMQTPTTPDRFSALYQASLDAALPIDWLRAAAGLLPDGHLEETWPVPFLTMLTNGPTPKPSEAHQARLQDLQRELSLRTRLDHWMLQGAFAAGNLMRRFSQLRRATLPQTPQSAAQ